MNTGNNTDEVYHKIVHADKHSRSHGLVTHAKFEVNGGGKPLGCSINNRDKQKLKVDIIMVELLVMTKKWPFGFVLEF